MLLEVRLYQGQVSPGEIPETLISLFRCAQAPMLPIPDFFAPKTIIFTLSEKHSILKSVFFCRNRSKRPPAVIG